MSRMLRGACPCETVFRGSDPEAELFAHVEREHPEAHRDDDGEVVVVRCLTMREAYDVVQHGFPAVLDTD